MPSASEIRRTILRAYREVYDARREAPYVHAREELPGRTELAYEALQPHVEFLEQQRYLHWKATDIFKLSPRGVRVTATDEDLRREFPDDAGGG
jgi:hypothetical protein